MTDRELFKELCENDFAFFCQQYLKVVEPETEFKWSWHLDTLCHYCEQVYHGDVTDLDINIPPRMLKSLIVSVLFPCWVWIKKPSTKFLCASRSFELSAKFNMKRRELVEADEYRSMWPIPLKDDQNTAKMFANYYGGHMQAASALGKIVGVGADILLSDDLLDTMDAFSKTKRESTNNWYSQAFHNRVQDKKTARRININQRLHRHDVSGHLKDNHPKFVRLILPMQMTENHQSDVPGFKDPREAGEFLHPERYGKEEKEAEYKSLGVYGWSSQMQQSPVPVGGGIIKNEWIRRYDPLNKIDFDKRIITADLNFKGGETADFVCFQAWGRKGSSRYLIDIVRGRWTYKETKERFLDFCIKHDISLKYIEDKANGPALISDLSSSVVGLTPWPAKGSKYVSASKTQRLHLCSQDFEGGEVYLPEGLSLVEEFVEELLSFTDSGSTTGNDDMVDTATMALLELKSSTDFFYAG